ncbi:hypothetical protein DPMN_185898 [Dreissena polymorpha]|uniref:Uncharacterized protein n=1 Tax=Dreissena polymorpha TaxID=45954 RepID=A0A9D4I7P7_DREPO|nr:hypothetical protein DPMN_185898 [Dreissena polymorpha]
MDIVSNFPENQEDNVTWVKGEREEEDNNGNIGNDINTASTNRRKIPGSNNADSIFRKLLAATATRKANNIRRLPETQPVQPQSSIIDYLSAANIGTSIDRLEAATTEPKAAAQDLA